ncbi:hypothetical protein K1720_06420 [Thermococcus argininiproducens]|uniref:Uncharacterized protein n=1 Tax=Thermococcus argininiproducens TaxID=2866384 RepID=A0A9E7MC59_9EURY|nr:hypothetical protein K1720_06420 [Thermococcus argininiproducens]
MFMVGVLFLSGFGFAGQFQEVKDSRVLGSSGTCGACSSCQDFNVGRALVEVNLKIENLTRIINQKEAELHKLYAEFNRTKSIETLEEIVKLEDEIQLLKSEKEFYKRQKVSLELIKKYTRKTPYGVEVLYYKLPKEDELVKQYIEKVHPVRKDVNLDWFIAYYRQAVELTFDEYIETDTKLREAIKEVKGSNATIEDVLKLIERRRGIWDEIYAYLEERDKLQTLKKLKELGKQQIMIKTITGIQPLAYNFGGINEGSSCLSWSCPPTMSYPPLPEYTPVYYSYASPTTVWVGLYNSSTPNVNKFWGEYCTYEFPSTSTDVKKYWDWAIEKANSKGFYAFKDVGSIQVKLFYSGSAYNPNNGEYQESNLIWQFECHKNPKDGKNECWVGSYKPKLPPYPSTVMFDQYFELYVYKYVLKCCKGGDVGNSCKWSNRHCGGCFAPDASSSQNFAWINRPYQEIIIRWEDS